jgi:hypothetical protein
MLIKGFFYYFFELIVQVSNESLEVFSVFEIKYINVHENFTELSLIMSSLNCHFVHIILLRVSDYDPYGSIWYFSACAIYDLSHSHKVFLEFVADLDLFL